MLLEVLELLPSMYTFVISLSLLFILVLSLVTLFNIYRHIFATLSFIAESCIFLYVGMDALDIEKWKFAGDV